MYPYTKHPDYASESMKISMEMARIDREVNKHMESMSEVRSRNKERIQAVTDHGLRMVKIWKNYIKVFNSLTDENRLSVIPGYAEYIAEYRIRELKGFMQNDMLSFTEFGCCLLAGIYPFPDPEDCVLEELPEFDFKSKL